MVRSSLCDYEPKMKKLLTATLACWKLFWSILRKPGRIALVHMVVMDEYDTERVLGDFSELNALNPDKELN